MAKKLTLVKCFKLRVNEYEEKGDHWQARPGNLNCLDFVRICMGKKNTENIG